MNNWYNLKRNKCPKCGKILGFNKDEEMIFCNDLHCGFQISQYRMEEIVLKINGKKYIARDNFSDLQNLDRPRFMDEETFHQE